MSRQPNKAPPHAYPNAKALFETFTHRPAKGTFAQNLKWPYPQCVAGRASRIGYRSDKFDSKTRDYTHAFGHEGKEGTDGTIYPVMLIQQCRSLPTWSKTFLPAEQGELALLGECLDLEIFHNSIFEEKHHFDFTGKARKPLLLGDPDRRILVIAPQNGRDVCMLLWSPILRITERGLEN